MADFSTTGVGRTGDIIAAPERQYANGNVLSGIADMVNTFQEDRAASAQRRRQATSDARDAERHRWAQEDRARTELGRTVTASFVRRTSVVEGQLDGAPAGPAAAPGIGGTNTPVGDTLNNAFGTSQAPGVQFATNFIENAVSTGQSDPETVTSIRGAVASAATTITSQAAAVEQGRMPGIAVTASIDNIVRDLINENPGYEDIVAAAVKEAGFENQMFNDLKAAYTAQTSRESARNEEFQSALRAGAEAAGPAAAGMTDAQLIASGLDIRQAEAQMRTNLQRMEIQAKELAGLEAQGRLNDRDREEDGRRLTQDFNQLAVAQLAPVLNSFNALLVAVGEPGSNPVLEGRLEEARLLVEQTKATIVNNLVAQMTSSTGPEAGNALRTSLENYITGTFTQPLTARDGSLGRLANQMEQRLGLQVQHSMPLIAQMRSAGLNPSMLGPLINAIGENGPLKNRLVQEVRGLSNMDIGTPMARTQLAEIIGIINGDERIRSNNISAPEARQIFRVVNGVMINSAPLVANGDMTAAEPFLNTVGEVAIAAGALNAQSGMSALVNAGRSLLGDRNDRTMTTAIERATGDFATAEQGRVTGLAYRGAAANVLQGLRANVPGQGTSATGFHYVTWSASRGQWQISRNERAAAAFRRQTQYSGGGDGASSARLRMPTGGNDGPPQELVGQVGLMNNLLGSLVNTASWDQNTPSGATPMELRNWYGRNQMSERIQRGVQAVRGQGRTSEATSADVNRRFDEFSSSLEQAGVARLTVPTTETENRASASVENNAQEVSSVLSSAGMPPAVVAGFLGNLEHESAIGTNRNSGDGGTAHGLAQWRHERVDNFERIIRKHPRDATIAEQARFVAWEMDNPGEAGMTVAQRDQILAADSPEEAARLIDRFYERSDGRSRNQRASAARRWMR